MKRALGFYFRYMFHVWFWKYLFTDLSWCENFRHKIQVIICRLKGHPNGPVWYNASGFEPDMSCKDCGDEL